MFNQLSITNKIDELLIEFMHKIVIYWPVRISYEIRIQIYCILIEINTCTCMRTAKWNTKLNDALNAILEELICYHIRTFNIRNITSSKWTV